ncbi:MAG: phage tail tape measure protein [Pseudomonas sp.]|uniref:phage tail tape measure protein n=1 Tax=Pseudomonas sp. TaxID=306 RepID=UPI00339461E6
MSSRDLRLRVLLAAVDKVTGPLKKIMAGSRHTAEAMKATVDQLKALKRQQADIASYRQQQAAITATSAKLNTAQRRLREMREEMKKGGQTTDKFRRDFTRANEAVRDLTTRIQGQRRELSPLVRSLRDAGVRTNDLGTHEDKLKRDINGVNNALREQKERLAAISTQQAQLDAAGVSYQNGQQMAGQMATVGAVSVATAYAISRPLQEIVDAFAPAEDAMTSLKVSMMRSDGTVAAEFAELSKMATQLGDRLPGTTADFQEMMATLQQQGISSKSILGGTGEAAAYLGVLLKKAPADAAEFAAKMQDSTRTVEGDMLGLMDVIQRANYLGVQSDNMLAGFGNLAPVMGVIKKEGLEAAKALAPLLVMMDQAGMAGESSGNAIRKVFQSGLDAKRFEKANEALAELKAGFTLDFTDGKGSFGGMEQMFAQLDKLKGLSDVGRVSVMKAMFGDDNETQRVIETFINKGLSGYQEVVAKMDDQADLRKRVNEQLETLTNITDAADGSFKNAMAEFGLAIAPELKQLVKWLGSMANKVGAWARENPKLAATLVKVVAAAAALLLVFGAISIGLAAMWGPMIALRYAFAVFRVGGLGVGGMLGRLFPTLVGLAKNALPWLRHVLVGIAKQALPMLGRAIMWVGRLFMLNPIGLVITALALGAYLLYKNWDTVGPFFERMWNRIEVGATGLWQEMKTGFSGGIGGITQTLTNFSPLGLFYRAFASTMSYFGVELPGKFTEFGANLLQGLINGITSKLGAVKDAVTGAGDSVTGWFKDTLGIHSPSRVFAELGGYTMQGLTLGLQGGSDGPLAMISKLGKRMTQAGAGLALGAAAMPLAAGMAIDNRAPIGGSSAKAPMVIQGDTIQITIQAGAGTDTNALRQTLNQLLDERERNKAARVRSRLSDSE